ncbi:MAG: thioredoxin [Pirellulaceae bacterium]
MSHPLMRELYTARTLFFLSVFPLAAGCGMTGSGYFANRTQSAPDDDLARAASPDGPPASTTADSEAASDQRPETANRHALPQETAVDQRRLETAGGDVPDEPTLELPSIGPNPSMAVANRGKLMEKPPTPEAAGAPERPSAVQRSASRATAAPRSHPVATTGFESFEEGKVHQVETDDFQAAVLESNMPVIVDFYADWCGPCKQVAPLLDQFAQERTDIRVVKVNIDDEQKLARKYRIESVPTVMVFKEGDLVAKHNGLPRIRQALSR